MEWVNITAKSLPEAIDLALDNLGVDEAEAEIEVLEEPKQGLFGRTRGNARVKARVKPKESRPKVERGRNRRRRSEGGGGGGRGGSEGRDRNRRSGGGGRRDGGGRDSGGRDGGNKERGDNRDREQSDSSGRSNAKKSSGNSSNKARANKQRQAEGPAKEVSVEEVSAHVESFLSGLVEAFGVDGDVRIDSDGDDGIIGFVEGQHGLMIGPKGRTLESIQELTRVTAQRSAPSNVRIKVDVGGYRQMRGEALQRFATKVAEEALADGNERSLEPMNAADRKIVHDALTDVDGIETRSAGTDPRRRVVVVPVEVDDVDEIEEDEELPVADEVEESQNGAEADDAEAEVEDEAAEAVAD